MNLWEDAFGEILEPNSQKCYHHAAVSGFVLHLPAGKKAGFN